MSLSFFEEICGRIGNDYRSRKGGFNWTKKKSIPVSDRVSPTADETLQQSGLRGRVLVHRKQGREPDGLGGAEQPTSTG